MTLSAGDRLGRYEILGTLGAGGMGEVYRARDTDLDRAVAIKVLPEAVSGDEARLERFRREARAVAKLAHPNILEIWDFGTEQGTTYAVTELLEGKTLRERVPSSGLPWQKVVEMGAAIADGLAAAHGKAIVHRDLKPENIFVTSDGRLKILDFGLASIREEVLTEADTGTLTPAGTVPGTVMGTVGYMAPEQVKGQPADARADIFALGCVLYEMVSGRRAFAGATTAEMIAAILKEDPPSLSGSGAGVPGGLERTIHRCLEKQPEARFQSASDLAYNLRSISTDADFGVVAPIADTPPRRLPVGLLTVAATTILVATIVAGWLWLARSKTAVPPPTATMFTTFPGEESAPALSPDGSMIAFSHGVENDRFDLYVKLVGGEDPLLLDQGSLGNYTPCWSPDGRQIAYVRCEAGDNGLGGCSVWVVPTLGGTARLVTRLQIDVALGLSWSPDGSLLALADSDAPGGRTRIVLYSFVSGERRRLSSPEPDTADEFPRFSPDGTLIAFARFPSAFKSNIHLVSVDGGEERQLTFGDEWIAVLDWTADGRRIVFQSNRPGRTGYVNLWEVSAAGGEPIALAFGDDAKWPNVSRRGDRLVFVRPGTTDVDLWRIGGPAAPEEDRIPTRFIASAGHDNYPQYSPDGRTIVFDSTRSGSMELWLCDADGSNPRQLTFFKDASVTAGGCWTPDGREIAFVSNREGNFDIYVVSAAGGVPRRITTAASKDFSASWSRDGSFIYFYSDRTGRWEVFKVPADGGVAQQVTSHGGTYAVESLDGEFLYYSKTHFSERPRGIWRMPVGGGSELQVHDQGVSRMWQLLEDGICYLDYASRPPTLSYFEFASGEVTHIAAVSGARNRGFAVSPDGQWVLYQREESERNIVLVENFR